MSIPTKLPPTMWKDDTIFMSPVVSAALRLELTARNQFNRACEYHPEDKPTGGEGNEETLRHFADRFKNSYARVAYVTLSPFDQFQSVSHHLLASVFDGSVAILDLPCGSGGGLHGLLSSVYELRAHKLLPRTPITIDVLGADISPLAQEIHGAMLNHVKDEFTRFGLRLSVAYTTWDATDAMQTADLLDAWVAKTDQFEEHLVFVSAFSDFAKTYQESLLQSFRDITLRLRKKILHVVWIEPDMKQVKGLFSNLIAKVQGWFVPDKSLDPELFEDGAEFHFQHPLVDRRIKGRVRVVTLRRF